MPAVGRLLVLAGLALAAPALAVGLGPLTKTGITDGPDKGFYLTLYNPYKQRVPFTVYAVGAADEIPQDRVRVPLKPIPLNAESARKFMIVAGQLAPGETYAFRVCAERFTAKEEPIHARVCSRITARRVGGGA